MGELLTATQKALKLNLDTHIYGTFAEIGAGQEVANNFFKAGAASGTVAKSISAYDMTFSDSIYGKEESKRYVCKPRLIKMLNYEYDLLLERLEAKRAESKFFAFANTVSARNFQGTNEQHGWLGLKFRHDSCSEASQIILHTRMHDNTALRQQEALGILGVNLIDTSFYKSNQDVSVIVSSLMENLSSEQIEIDMISCSGPAFEFVDERLLNLQLVKSEITDSIVFNTKGEVSLASDELYKKNVLIARGSYRPPTNVNMDILSCGESEFIKDIGEDDILTLAEITISQLQNDGSISNEDFLARVDLLASLDQMVMVSSFKQYYRLTNFLTRFRPKNIAIVLGIYNFMQIFDNEYNLATGKTLEAIGMLLGEKVKVYLYPYKESEKATSVVDLSCVEVKKDRHRPLLEFIKQSGEVKDLTEYNEKTLHIFSRKVLDMITSNEDGWEDFVPTIVAKTIKDKCLFGKPC